MAGTAVRTKLGMPGYNEYLQQSPRRAVIFAARAVGSISNQKTGCKPGLMLWFIADPSEPVESLKIAPRGWSGCDSLSWTLNV